MPQEIFLEIVDQRHDVPEDRFIDRSTHQELLRAENLRHLGEDHPSAERRQPVGDAPDERVGGDPAQAVRAAAFVAEHEIGGGALHPRIALHRRRKLRHGFEPCIDLVRDLLAIEEPEPRAIDVSGEPEQAIHLIIFAAEPEHQHAARVGMAHQAGEGALRVPEIVAELAAAVGMRETVDPVDRSPPSPPGEPLRSLPRNPLGRVVDAADRVEDPHLVARADPAGPAAVAAEERGTRNAEVGTAVPRFAFRLPRSVKGLIPILHQPLEARFQIVSVHPGTGRDRRGHLPDREAVFHDRLARLERPKRDLVARGNVLAEHDALALDHDAAPRGERPYRHRDVVRRMDFDRLRWSGHRAKSR